MLKSLFTSFGSHKARMVLLCISLTYTITNTKLATQEVGTSLATNPKKNKPYHNRDISSYYQKLENTIKKVIKKNQDMLYVSPLNNEFAEFIVDYIGALKSSRHKRASFLLKKICDELLEEKGLKHKKNIKEGKVTLALLKHLGIDRSYEIVRFVLRKKNRPTIIYFKEKGLHYRRNTKTHEETDVTWGRFEKIALKAQEVKIGEIIKPQASFLDWLLINPKAGLTSLVGLVFLRDILNEKAKLQKENKKLYKILLQRKIEEEKKEDIRVLFTPSKTQLQGSVKRQSAGQGLYNFGTTCYFNTLFQSLRRLHPNGELFGIKHTELENYSEAARNIYEIFYKICDKIKNNADSITNALLYDFFVVLDKYAGHTHIGHHEDPSEVLVKIMQVFDLTLFEYRWIKSNVNFTIQSKGNLEAFKHTISQENMGAESLVSRSFLQAKISEDTDEEKTLNIQDFIDNYTDQKEEVEVACLLDVYIKGVHNKDISEEQKLQIKKVLAIQLINKHDGFPKSWGEAIPQQYRNTKRKDLLKKSQEDWATKEIIKIKTKNKKGEETEEERTGKLLSGIKYEFTKHAERKRKADGTYQTIPNGFGKFMAAYLLLKQNKIEEKNFSEGLDKKLKDILIKIVQDQKEVEDIIKSLKISEDEYFNPQIKYTYTKRAQDLQVVGDTAIIHVVRFRGLIDKLTNPIENAETITIGDKDFELVAFARHIGKALKRGHYIAYVKEEDGEWRCYDDQTVQKITSEDAQKDLQEKGSAYVLFYKQQNIEDREHDLV